MYKLLIGCLILALTSACSMKAPPYQPDFNIVNDLNNDDIQSISVGEIESQDPKVNKLSLRGSPMLSPYNNSYADYLEEALQEQLTQANLFDAESDIEIRGELLENKVNAKGIKTGTANLSARFEVENGSVVKFDKIKTIQHEWKSSFVGAIAIPNAAENYPIAVQKLVAALMSDPDFIAAVKK